MPMRLLKPVVLALVLLSQAAVAQRQGTRTVFLVPHAEKASSAPDAGLSPAGKKRADCLARMMKEAGIKQIFVTDAKRTQETAAPLAAALKITPTMIPAKDPNTLIRGLLYSGGGNILVVGHSDTLPFVVARLKAGSVPPIAENEYDRMLVTTVIEGGAIQASTLHYCECVASPSSIAPASTKSGDKRPDIKKKKP